MILQLRIDERLVYKQVCAAWLEFLKASHLLIANDYVESNENQKTLMSLTIPRNVKHLFTTVDRAIEIMNDPKAASLKIFPIVKTPADALKILNSVEGINDVVFGKFGSQTPLDKSTLVKPCQGVAFDAENVALVKQIKEKIKKDIFFQDVPSAEAFKLNF